VPLTVSSRSAGALAATLTVLLLAGCGGAEDAANPTTTSPTATSAATQPASTPVDAPTTSAPSSAPSTPAADVTLDITVSGGKVSPSGKNVPVKAGQTVRMTATSDVADTIHVHGYDKQLAMTPGQTTSLTFVADSKGSFEIETHESGKLVAKLIVS